MKIYLIAAFAMLVWNAAANAANRAEQDGTTPDDT